MLTYYSLGFRLVHSTRFLTRCWLEYDNKHGPLYSHNCKHLLHKSGILIELTITYNWIFSKYFVKHFILNSICKYLTIVYRRFGVTDIWTSDAIIWDIFVNFCHICRWQIFARKQMYVKCRFVMFIKCSLTDMFYK